MLNIDPLLLAALDRPDTPWEAHLAILDEVAEHDSEMLTYTSACLLRRTKAAASILFRSAISDLDSSHPLTRTDHPLSLKLRELQFCFRTPEITPAQVADHLFNFREFLSQLADALDTVFTHSATMHYCAAHKLQHALDTGADDLPNPARDRTYRIMDHTVINRHTLTSKEPLTISLWDNDGGPTLSVTNNAELPPAQQRAVNSLYQRTLRLLEEHHLKPRPPYHFLPGSISSRAQLVFEIPIEAEDPDTPFNAKQWTYKTWIPWAFDQLSEYTCMIPALPYPRDPVDHLHYCSRD